MKTQETGRKSVEEGFDKKCSTRDSEQNSLRVGFCLRLCLCLYPCLRLYLFLYPCLRLCTCLYPWLPPPSIFCPFINLFIRLSCRP